MYHLSCETPLRETTEILFGVLEFTDALFINDCKNALFLRTPSSLILALRGGLFPNTLLYGYSHTEMTNI